MSAKQIFWWAVMLTAFSASITRNVYQTIQMGISPYWFLFDFGVPVFSFAAILAWFYPFNGKGESK